MKNINCFASKRGVLSAFTLAEMMVVMLILSIVLAAMAPVMTTRNKPNNSSPWQYEGGQRQNAWFGGGANQEAMIGQHQKRTGDIATKLQITLGSGDTTTSLLAFKRGDTQLGRLYMNDDGGLMFGSTTGVLGSNSNAVGRQVEANASNSTAFGSVAKANGNNSTAVGATVTASGANSIAIGSSTTASGSDSIGIGNSATATTQAIAFGSGAEAKSNDSVAVGYLANVSENSTGAIAIGASTTSTANYAIAIGQEANATKAGNIAIGVRSDATGQNSIALSGIAGADNTIAIGNSTNAKEEDSIAIGYGATVNSRSTGAMYYGKPSIAIGYNTVATPGSEEQGISVAIGAEAIASKGGIAIGSKYYKGTSAIMATGSQSIAIGQGAYAYNTNNIAIGRNACSNVTGANKICIGANSGPKSTSDWAKDDVERVFIGGKSNFNGGPAVLEVHNDTFEKGIGNLMSEKRTLSSTVVVNGTLIVKGGILSSTAANTDECSKGGGNCFRSKEDVKMFADRNQDYQAAVIPIRYGIEKYAENGTFRSPFNDWPEIKISDRRLKYVGKENTSGLDKIRQLKIFNYTYKKDTTKTPHVGVIAQDLQKVFPNAVKKGADGFLTIRMEDMFYAVINAIKELDAKYQAQEKRINELEKRIEILEAKTK